MPEASADMRAIADQIKKAREAAGWSQHELADRAGVSRPSVARVEAGGDVNTVTLRKIAEALGLSLHVGSYEG
ncbi:helix-turn-helix domain-containing protein [Leucobacter chromiiresistens]|uniref:Helix-turn-helix n=1 Tax=Leucobacter chromiiresistens TaxID=1079994 RepID=A0A1H0Z4U2_9MICO|nr:helix-turn-helix transcriptional regulator [Leucobacter chromiiresistens]SDQ22394.1 Helix-turn-helix [Leucobacter chromiiresistens]